MDKRKRRIVALLALFVLFGPISTVNISKASTTDWENALYSLGLSNTYLQNAYYFGVAAAVNNDNSLCPYAAYYAYLACYYALDGYYNAYNGYLGEPYNQTAVDTANYAFYSYYYDYLALVDFNNACSMGYSYLLSAASYASAGDVYNLMAVSGCWVSFP